MKQIEMFPPVGCKYGAPFGRPDETDDYDGKPLHLMRAKFVDGDYDVGGAYWGSPATVWGARNSSAFLTVRAHSREEAKAEIRLEFPDAKFFR